MGVPGFYRWLVQRYPLTRRRLDDISRPKIDNFYVDFNCIIYNALRLASSTGHPYTSLFQETCRYLDLLIQIARPQNVLFIAVDGPAPFAKCAQQRSRRFVAARDAAASGSSSFDTTSVSVGTEFMELLNKFLIDFITEKTKNDLAWQKPQVIYSSHRVPGEGEHKFFNYIRSIEKMENINENNNNNNNNNNANNTNNNNNDTRKNSTKNLVHCVYSPDADLIFLGLQTRLPYFYLLREWDSWVGPHENVGNGKLNKLKAADSDFEFINLTLAREFFQIDYAGIDDVNRIVDDFAAFSFLIGNDFIPHFPDISIQSGQFEQIIETYQNTLMKEKLYLIENGQINKSALKKLLISSVQKMSLKKPNGKNGVSFSVDPELAASKYLQEKYPDEFAKNKEELEKKLAFAALDSFDWVLEYYTKGCPSWNWCYPYFYAPPVTTIAKYCLEHHSHFDIDRPPMPIEQLLCILPPKSAKLLPESAKALMFEPSPLAKFYPDTFKIDLNGRRFEHEGVVLIPLVDVKVVREEVAKILVKLSPEEKERNDIMVDMVFEKGSHRNFDPKNDFIIKGSFSDAPAFVPSLNKKYKIDHTCSKENIKVNIFGRQSNAASIFIHTNTHNDLIPTKAKDVECLLNKPVLINWPYLVPALVSQIFDSHEVFPRNSPLSKKIDWKIKLDKLTIYFKENYGIDIGGKSTHIILVVRPLISSRLEEDQFRFSRHQVFYPYQLSVSCLSVPNVLYRLTTPENPPLQVNSLAVIIDGPHKGKLCKILSVNNNNNNNSDDNDDKEANVEIIENSPQVDLTFDFSKEENEWTSIDNLMSKLKLEYDKAKLLLTSLPGPSDPNETNFAFTALADKKVLDGFCRVHKVDNKTEHQFTKEFVISIGEYAYSDLAGDLLKVLRDADIRNLKALNPQDIWQLPPADRRAKLRELVAFLKNSICSKYFLIDESIQIVSQATLSRIEHKIIQSLNRNNSNNTNNVNKIIITNTSINNENNEKRDNNSAVVVTEKLKNLIWPGKQKEILQHAEIGAKVINISYTGPVPFGQSGVVVGVDHQKMQYHIMLYEENDYATSLRKRLETKRGYIAKVDDLFFY